MKHLIIILFCLAGTTGFGQDVPGKMQQRVEAQRIAFMTQKLDLTPKESAGFWPLYNQFKDEQKALRAKSLKKEFMRMTDEEADAVIAAQLDSEQKLVDLKRTYIVKLREVLPPHKIANLFAVEQAFNKEILTRIREWRKNR